MKAINITAYTDDASQIASVKKVIKELKIKYSISKVDTAEKPYNPDFVAMIKQREKELKMGRGVKMPPAELEKSGK